MRKANFVITIIICKKVLQFEGASPLNPNESCIVLKVLIFMNFMKTDFFAWAAIRLKVPKSFFFLIRYLFKSIESSCLRVISFYLL